MDLVEPGLGSLGWVFDTTTLPVAVREVRNLVGAPSRT
jgi:hypothetical protein